MSIITLQACRLGHVLTPSHVHALFEELDVDGNGTVEWQELKAALEGKSGSKMSSRAWR